MVNVPVDSTKEILRGLFAGLGSRLEDVRFHKDNDDLEDIEKLKLPDTWDRKLICTGGSVHITFPTEEDVNKIFKTISKERRNQIGPIREWGVGITNPTSSLGLQRTPLAVHLQF